MASGPTEPSRQFLRFTFLFSLLRVFFRTRFVVVTHCQILQMSERPTAWGLWFGWRDNFARSASQGQLLLRGEDLTVSDMWSILQMLAKGTLLSKAARASTFIAHASMYDLLRSPPRVRVAAFRRINRWMAKGSACSRRSESVGLESVC